MSNKIKSRIIIRKKKDPIPKLSISIYYQDYKVYKDFSLEEITTLISNKRKHCSYAKNENELNRIKTEIKLLEDLYTLKLKGSIKLFNKFRQENKEMFFNTELGVSSHCILCYLNYRTPIYTEECIKIAKCIDKDNIILEDIQMEVAASIVKEILDHYKAKFDEEKIIKDYNLNENEFYKYYLSIHRWCKKNYWLNR